MVLPAGWRSLDKRGQQAWHRLNHASWGRATAHGDIGAGSQCVGHLMIHARRRRRKEAGHMVTSHCSSHTEATIPE